NSFHKPSCFVRVRRFSVRSGNNNYINTTTEPYGQPFSSFPPKSLRWTFDSRLHRCRSFGESFSGQVIDLGTQLKSFKTVKRRVRSALGEAETKRIFSRAVYLFNIGGNDLFYALFQTSSLVNLNAKQKLVDLIIGNTTSVVEEVYKMGGRKFGFLNVGAYDCAPAASILDTANIGSCNKPVTELIDLHNKKFPDGLRRLQRELSGFNMPFTTIALPYWIESTILLNTGLRKGTKHVVEADH
ncbi:hypothetical protein HID58_093771, partial [Brassica napus]